VFDVTGGSARGAIGAVRLGKVVLDCPDPRRLGRFYAELLGCRVSPGSEDRWVDLEGAGALLSFQRVRGYEPPSWPDGVPQQVHLDLEVDSFAETHERAVALGAVPLDPTTPPAPADTRGYRVYADPAGHPFCLCRCAAG